MAKSGRLELGDNIYGHYRSIFNHCDVFGQQSNSIWWKMQNKATTPCKVIEVCTNRKPICDFLLVIDSNWQPVSYRCGVIAAYCSNFGHFAFRSHLWGLRDNIWCSSWAHRKAHSGLPISDNWTFFARCYGWCAPGENREKIGNFAGRGQFDPKFQVEGDIPHQLFLHG